MEEQRLASLFYLNFVYIMAEFFPEVRTKPSEEAPNQGPVNPVVFLDISSESQLLGRIQIELFADTCPKVI